MNGASKCYSYFLVLALLSLIHDFVWKSYTREKTGHLLESHQNFNMFGLTEGE